MSIILPEVNRFFYHNENHVKDLEFVLNEEAYTISVYQNHDLFDFSFIAWVKNKNSKAVSMVRFFTPTQRYGNKAVMCDVETHPSLRGQGIAFAAITALGKEYGTLHSTGYYSVSGLKALSTRAPLLDGNEVLSDNKTVNYSFVDWIHGRTK